jgi:3-methyladenine DNA glycosylase/8-oxoguanine DNA glycosylase
MNGCEIIVTNIPSKNCLSLQIPAELSHQSHTVLGKTRALFDLDANPLVIEAALSRDLFLRQLIARHSVLRVPGCWDNFELLLRVILGQQISMAGATTTMRRLVDRIGVTPTNIAASSPEAIAAIGMPLKRATTIWMLGDMVQSGALHLDERDPQLFTNSSWPYQALDHGQLNTCACACCIGLMLFLLAISACKKQLCRVSARLNGN